MIMENFDVVVIGGGPGGYVAAIKAAQLGLKVACVEKRKTLGGTCLNIGCIPSKALLDSSEKYAELTHKFADHGINCSSVKLDLAKMISRKDEIVKGLTKGIEGLLKKNKITHYCGTGKIIKQNEVEVSSSDIKKVIGAKNIVIATGADVISIPNVEINEQNIVSSTGALSLKKVPKKMIVIGGGYIGLEMGSVWQRLGAEVEVIEFMDSIVSSMDNEIGLQLHKSLEKEGIKFRLSTKVLSAKSTNKTVEINVENVKTNKQEKLSCDALLVAVGRSPYTKNLGIDVLGIQKDSKGKIVVNDKYATNIPNIYAIGDVIDGPMLAHKAEDEGVAVAEFIAGQVGHVNYNAIPAVIYTSPEVASVGQTEEQLKKANLDYNVGKFPFLANGRAKASGCTDGMVKILACKKTDKILGAHIIGPNAGTMIAELVLAMEYMASSEDVARTIHAHPTLNEAVKEAALATFSKALHI